MSKRKGTFEVEDQQKRLKSNRTVKTERYEYYLEKRKRLPIWRHRDEFFDVLGANQVLVLMAEPGSGKSTQIPQFVLEALECEIAGKRKKYMVACTQPYSVAAKSVALRVAQEMDVNIGEQVGYSIQFEDCSSQTTVLKYLTDGMLLREAMSDPLLQNYEVIILDGVHERTIATDSLLGLCKKLLKSRLDLKLVIMSTLIEAKEFQDFFSGAPLIKVREWHYPVDITYVGESVRNCLQAAIDTVRDILRIFKSGDILLFLAGEEKIEDTCKKLTKEIEDIGDSVGPVKIVPLYSTLPFAMQQKIFEPAPPPLKDNGPPGRKIVVSTNIAETSLTIDGIRHVIDAGFVEQKEYYPRIHVESLLVSRVSKASAHRRLACAGKTRRGHCCRLYTEDSFNTNHPAATCPEILRSNVTNTVLTLKKIGILDIDQFDYMARPTPETLCCALEALVFMGASLNEKGKLTDLGELMGEFPLDLQMSKMLIASVEYNCSEEILSISAMLSVPNCFIRPGEEAADEARACFLHSDGDHLTLLNVYHAYKQSNKDSSWCNANFLNLLALRNADNIRQKLAQIMAKFNLKLCSTDSGSPDYYPSRRLC